MARYFKDGKHPSERDKTITSDILTSVYDRLLNRELSVHDMWVESTFTQKGVKCEHYQILKLTVTDVVDNRVSLVTLGIRIPKHYGTDSSIKKYLFDQSISLLERYYDKAEKIKKK